MQHTDKFDLKHFVGFLHYLRYTNLVLRPLSLYIQLIVQLYIQHKKMHRDKIRRFVLEEVLASDYLYSLS